VKTYSVFIGAGSNLGDRAARLVSAAHELKAIEGVKYIWASSVYETDPYGKTDQPKFLNAVLQVETSLTPPELLKKLKAIEERQGRTSGERWGPREIDLDILIYDGVVYQDDVVVVPHPDLEHRKFALVPLREIAPDLVHPVTGMTIEELLKACSDGGRVQMTSYRIHV
jgi:2-amino-4-hydroxy-6-hydroxymethyldihydropteridine diphosphokinase